MCSLHGRLLYSKESCSPEKLEILNTANKGCPSKSVNCKL